MDKKYKTASQALLSDLTLTGVTESGEVKELELKVIPNIETNKKEEFEEEFLLINKLPEAGVKIKAVLSNGGPSFNEKMMFMLGEATFALSLMTKPVIINKSDSEHFKEFMEGFIDGVVKYHCQSGAENN